MNSAIMESAFGRRGRRTVLVLIGVLVILPLLLCLIGKSLNPITIGLAPPYSSPSATFWAGADELGRPLLARILLAGGLSLRTAAVALATAWFLAILLGSLIGSEILPGLSRTLTLLLDVIQSIPFILFAIALGAIWENASFGLGGLIGIAACAAPARLVAVSWRSAATSKFVVAQKSLGHGGWLLFRTAYFPAIASPPLIWLLVLLPELLTVDAGLSLFGLGAQPPTPTLGRLIFSGFHQAQVGWWLPLAPTLVLLVLILVAQFAATYASQTFIRSHSPAH